MKLTFYGHAAFLLETAGKRIIFDPFRSPDSGGYAPIAEHADLVVVSHINDRYHSHVGQIAGAFPVVNGLEIPPGGAEALGLRFEAIPVSETPERLPGDEVSIVHLNVEGLHLVHLGDLGHLLDPAELAPIRGADVVLCPAGGTPTIALDQVAALLRDIEPRVVIPMHYKTPRINLNIQTRDDFLAAVAPLGWPVEQAGTSQVELDRTCIPTRTTIVCLEPAR